MTDSVRLTNPIEALKTTFKRAYPAWDVWAVPRVVGGTLWCAKRTGQETASLQANSPGQLAAWLEENPQ